MKKQRVVILMLGVLLCCGGLAQATLVWINNVEIIPSHPLDIDLINFNITGGAATATSHIEYDQIIQNGTSLQLDLYVKAGMVTVPRSVSENLLCSIVK